MALQYNNGFIDFDIIWKPKPNPYLKRIKMGEEYYLVKILFGCDKDDYPISSVKKIMVMNFPNTTAKVRYATIENNKPTRFDGCIEIFEYGIPTRGQTPYIIRLTTTTALCKDKKAVSEFVKFYASRVFTKFNNLGELTNKDSYFRQKAFSLYKQTINLVKKL